MTIHKLTFSDRNKSRRRSSPRTCWKRKDHHPRSSLSTVLESVSVLPMRLVDNWPEGLFGIGSPEESKQETVYLMSDASSESYT